MVWGINLVGDTLMVYEATPCGEHEKRKRVLVNNVLTTFIFKCFSQLYLN